MTLKRYVIDALTERIRRDREEEDRRWEELVLFLTINRNVTPVFFIKLIQRRFTDKLN